jgi:hypothetical protein
MNSITPWALLTILWLGLLPLDAAHAGPRTHFGKDHPFKLGELPPGLLQQSLQRLPQPAQQRAMTWLHTFNFPANDAAMLRADKEGGIHYVDTFTLTGGTSPTSDGVVVSNVAPVDTFLLHSRPGAKRVIYLDFNGHVISNTAWNQGLANPLNAVPYTLDGDATTFSDSERTSIAAIWQRVAEDYAPFDVDVTTEEPTTFGATTGRILITRDSDANGNAMPAKGAGGVAYVGVFGLSNYGYYSPALVYFNNLGGGREDYVSEAASHEMGHNLSLSHDGTSTSAYYGGHGSGDTSWGPLMGTGYNRNVSQWSKGEYVGANNQEDDVQLIGNKLLLRGDDHGNTFATATPLLSDSNGVISATTPDQDPQNLQPQNKGIIGSTTDVDMFQLDVAAGNLTLNVTPLRMPSNTRGGNLDILARLYDAQGVLINEANPSGATSISLQQSVNGGRYYLAVQGTGDPLSPYSNYGSLGQYFISGTIPVVASDTTAPTPDPLTWAVLPTAISRTSITLRATDAIDDSGLPVQYTLQCVTGGAACPTLAWQSSPQMTVTGLTPATGYRVQIRARDSFGNPTAWSDVADVTTFPNQVPIANNDVAAGPEDNPLTIAALGNDSDLDGDSLSITSVTTPSHGSASINNNQILYLPGSNFFGNDSLNYTIGDGFGGSATARVDISIAPVNDPPVAVSDSAKVLVKQTIDIPVLANDSDVEGSPLQLISVSSAKKGTASVQGNQVHYQAGTKNGSETLSYQVSDGQSSSIGSLTITISRR